MKPYLLGLAFVLFAPLVGGLLAGVDRILSARMQGRVGPPLLQPFYDVSKLLHKAPRVVNPIAEPLLLGHLGFMALTGALFLGGTDLLFTAFVFALSTLLLALAANSSDSPYSSTGAERELVAMLACEPLLILLLACVCKVTGESSFLGVLGSRVAVAPALPGVLVAFLVVVTVKLRKSPFDLAASHHAHQELVRGLTSDFSGRLLAWVEVAHWYEAVVLSVLVILFFNWSLPLGIAAALLVYFLEVLVDNCTSRVRWQLMLRSTWIATALFAGGNVLFLYLGGR
jgi:formate hydrogenlyase subunit 4